LKVLLTAVVAGVVALAGCDSGHKVDGHAHAPGDEHGASAVPGTASPVEAPTTLQDAAAKLETAHRDLAAIVKDGDLSKAHEAAERIKRLAEPLAELATKAGLPAADVKEVNLASKELQSLFKDMDEAGDAGRRDDAKAVFAKYEKPLATVKKHAGHGH